MLPYLAPPAAETTDSYSFNPKLPAGVKPVGPVEIDWSNPITRDLVGVYLLDGNHGAINIVDGVYGDPSSVTFGGPNTVFDGTDDKIDIPQHDITGACFIAAIADIDASSGDGAMFYNGKQGAKGVGEYSGISLRGISGKVRFSVVDSNSFSLYKTTNAVVSGRSVIAGNFTGGSTIGNIGIYINGEAAVQTSGSSGTFNSANITATYMEPSIGVNYYTSGTSNWFKGNIEAVFIWRRRFYTAEEVRDFSRNPYQFLKPVSPIRITTPKPTALTYEYTIPDARWEAPAIMVPGVKPTGPVVPSVPTIFAVLDTEPVDVTGKHTVTFLGAGTVRTVTEHGTAVEMDTAWGESTATADYIAVGDSYLADQIFGSNPTTFIWAGSIIDTTNSPQIFGSGNAQSSALRFKVQLHSSGVLAFTSYDGAWHSYNWPDATFSFVSGEFVVVVITCDGNGNYQGYTQNGGGTETIPNSEIPSSNSSVRIGASSSSQGSADVYSEKHNVNICMVLPFVVDDIDSVLRNPYQFLLPA